MGPTPTSAGLDSEIFDRTDFPYSETFVREAIQNSLDARLDPSRPVRVDFTFHDTDCSALRSLLDDVFSFRKTCKFSIPRNWSQDKISWLVVQDFHATGLSGDIHQRSSDFWNYWLNFGQSNKDESRRGGRGIGRVTFLIASRIQTVIGYTRRSAGKDTQICGMTILNPTAQGSKYRSTHAYLARKEYDSIYELHTGTQFHEDVINGFKFADYEITSDTGFALAIPYPHEELNPESILAAAIENFAPTIIDGTLKLCVDRIELDSDSIEHVANHVKTKIREPSIADDPQRYISLIRTGLTDQAPTYEFQLSESDKTIDHPRYQEVATEIVQHLESHESCRFEVSVPLTQNSQASRASLKAVVAKTPDGVPSFDRFFRDGMCLPKVRSQSPRDFDLLLFGVDDLLGRYLNLCEGKAHLDLSRSKAITEKLRSHRFCQPLYRVRDLIKSLPQSLRRLFDGDLTQPDASVFENLFSVSTSEQKSKSPTSGQPRMPDITNKPKPFKISVYRTGLRVAANTTHEQWPVDLFASVAYADGNRRPNWNEADFELKSLQINHKGCENCTVSKNSVEAHRCNSDFKLEIIGFDSNRELIVNWRTAPHAVDS